MLDSRSKNTESTRTKFNSIFEQVDVNLRRTKIVCTLGPSTEPTDTMVKMIDAGMNAACLNFAESGSDQKVRFQTDLMKNNIDDGPIY